MAIYLIIIAVVAVLLYVPSLLEFSFVWNETEKKVTLRFRYLFYKKNIIPSNSDKKEKIKKKEKKKKKKYTFEEVKTTAKRFIKIFDAIKSDIAKILYYAKKHAVKIDKLNTDIKFDNSDPMKTGIMTGTINGVIYNLIAFLDRNITLKEWKVSAVGQFKNRDFFDIRIDGIIRIKNAHIIVILARIVPIFLRIRKLLKEK